MGRLPHTIILFNHRQLRCIMQHLYPQLAKAPPPGLALWDHGKLHRAASRINGPENPTSLLIPLFFTEIY
jgi:hypothetical protein